MTDPYREAEATLGRLREEFQAGRDRKSVV